MALAWLGHLCFGKWGLLEAVVASWFLVLPEYFLNVAATRWGHGYYSGAQMATFNLSSGVVCVALVSRFVLKETHTRRQWMGFCLMAVGIALVMYR
jgi:hypothetical protein